MNNFWTLVKFEYRKIIKTKAFLLFSVLCLVYVIVTAVNGASKLTYYINDENMSFQQERQMQMDISRQNKGYISKEMIDNAIQSVKELVSDESNFITDNYGKNITGYAFIKYVMPYQNVISLLNFTYLCDYDSTATDGLELIANNVDYDAISKLSVDDIDKFYADVHEVTSNLLSMQGNLSDEEREHCLQMINNIEVPFYNDYYQGYVNYIQDTQGLAMLVLFSLLIIVAPVFSSEYERKTDYIILSSRNGKGSLCFAKIFVVITFTLLFSAFFMILLWLGHMIPYEFSGGNVNMQILDLSCIFNVTLFQGTLIRFISILISCLMFTMFVSLVSAVVKSKTFPVVGIGMAIIIVPMFMQVTKSAIIYNLMLFLPAYATAWNMETHFFDIGGSFVTPYKVVWVVSIFMICILPLIAVNSFKKHQSL